MIRQDDCAPAQLKLHNQWVMWKYEDRTDGAKRSKVPYQINGHKAASNNPTTWSTFKAVKAAREHAPDRWAGIGFVFTSEDRFVGIDLDDCLVDGDPKPWCEEVLEQFPGAYVEQSPSGNGLKIFCQGELPTKHGAQASVPDGGQIEAYSQGRYFTVTGAVWNEGGEVVVSQSGIDWLFAEYPDLNKASANELTADQHEFKHDDYEHAVKRARAYAENTPGAVSGQGGHNATFALACTLVNGFALQPEHAFEILNDWNTTCEPPWSDRDLRRKVTQATKETGERGYKLEDKDASHYAEVSANLTCNGKPAPQPSLVTLKPSQLLRDYPELRDPIVDGVFRAGEVVNINAAPKVGKSLLAMQLAVCIAVGDRKWLDHFPVRQGRVLYIDNEVHRENLSYRYTTMISKMGVRVAACDEHLEFVSLRGDLCDIHRLAHRLQPLRHRKFDVIILDAFYRFLPQGMSENENGPMADIYNLLDTMAAEMGSAFVLIHHTSKGDQSRKNVTDMGSGAGSMARAADTHVGIWPHQLGEGMAVLEAATRSFRGVDPLSLNLVWPVWKAEQAVAPEKHIPNPSKANSDAADREEIEQALEYLVKHGPTHQNFGKAIFGWDKRQSARRIKKMITDGLIERTDQTEKRGGHEVPVVRALPQPDISGLHPSNREGAPGVVCEPEDLTGSDADEVQVEVKQSREKVRDEWNRWASRQRIDRMKLGIIDHLRSQDARCGELADIARSQKVQERNKDLNEAVTELLDEGKLELREDVVALAEASIPEGGEQLELYGPQLPDSEADEVGLQDPEDMSGT